jgi:AraC-like DNA-binding protein
MPQAPSDMQLTEFPAPPLGAHGAGPAPARPRAIDSLVEGMALLRSPRRTVRTLVAESRLSIGVRLAGSASVWRDGAWAPLPRFTLTGLHCSSRTVCTEGGSVLALVHLHPAAAAMFGVDPERAAEGTWDLAGWWPASELEALAQAMAQAPDDSTCVARLAHAVSDRLAAAEPPAPAIVEAVRRLREEAGGLRIATLAQALAISVDTLERRFRATIGVSPKRFARAVRLRAAVLSYGAGMALTELAVGAGFYDQSHFIREMRLATGSTPQGLLRGQAIC